MRTSTSWIVLILCAIVPARAAAVDELVSARSALVIPGKVATFSSQARQQPGGAPFALPAPGSADDPTLHGAKLSFADVGLVGGSVQYALDASGWRALGTPPGASGYRYRGRDDVVDPNPKGTCRSVILRTDSIRAVCRDDVPLTTPFGDAATVVLAMGSAPTFRYCAELGGDETRNGASSLKRKNAPPPVACPLTECPTAGVVPSASVGGGCWYYGLGMSCDDICDFVGLRYSEATRTFAGSDGTNANCDAVLAGLGLPGADDADCTTIGIDGFGCFFPAEVGPPSIRCTDPPTTSSAGHVNADRACACR